MTPFNHDETLANNRVALDSFARLLTETSQGKQ